MLNPLYIAVSWVLLEWHRLFSTFLSPQGGLSWALSILMLVVTIRIVLFRFFIKQVHNQRKMQEIQPKIAALREKYKGDRQTLSQEMMKMQKEEGFNPLGGCLPILMQAPIFLSLFHVLRLIGTAKAPALYKEYHWRQDEVNNAGGAKLFGAPIAAAFKTPIDTLHALGGNQTATRAVTFVLIVLMCAATFITQKQIMSRSGQVLDGQQAMIQKLLLYGMPISLFVSGFLFPLGVLLYWFTNNLWTMGQQFYILHRMPPPGAKPDTGKPVVVAPRPGQKPVNPRVRRPAAPAVPTTTTPTPAADAADTPSAAEPSARRGRAGRPADAAAPAAPAAGTDGATPGSGSAPASRRNRRGSADPATPASPADAHATPAESASGQNPGGLRGWRDTPAAEPDGQDGQADEAPDGPESVDGASPPNGPSGGSALPGAPTSAPRPARRPPARRSSTTTRPKKKRR